MRGGASSCCCASMRTLMRRAIEISLRHGLLSPRTRLILMSIGANRGFRPCQYLPLTVVGDSLSNRYRIAHRPMRLRCASSWGAGLGPSRPARWNAGISLQQPFMLCGRTVQCSGTPNGSTADPRSTKPSKFSIAQPTMLAHNAPQAFFVEALRIPAGGNRRWRKLWRIS